MFGNSHMLVGLTLSSSNLLNNTDLFQAQAQAGAAPWWLLWLLLGLSVLSAMIWWIAGRRGEEAAVAPSAVAPPQPAATIEPQSATAEPPSPDDLTRIEGIGPKISEALQATGIRTFAQLAGTEVSRLQEILEASGPNLRLANPDTWPEQAGLAAKGDWAALETLQDELDGGRRVG
jgi:predicted flap endonuclease-1-like 5' DNA nuclease